MKGTSIFFAGAIALLAMCVSSPADAFRSTKSQSFTDPDYIGYQVKRVVLVVNADSNDMRVEIEERMAAAMKKKGIEVLAIRDVFPPTREWTADTQREMLAKLGIESVLVVTAGASASAIIPIMTQTHSSTTGSAYVYGNHVSGSASTNTTSMPIYGARSKAEFSAVLRDAAAGRIVWYADVTVKAAGTLFVSEAGDAKGVVSELVDALAEDGHIPGKKK